MTKKRGFNIFGQFQKPTSNQIICHIVGLDPLSKELIIKNFANSSQLTILDLDKLNELLFSENEKIENLDKKINSLENKKNNKQIDSNEKEKLKFYKKKLTKLWKDTFKKELDNNISPINTKIILIGNSNLYNNIRVYHNINSKLKYIVKINYVSHIEKIIENNLTNFKDDIIKGEFPLEYISKNYLLKKRQQFDNYYITKGYSMQSIDQIIFTIKSNITRHNNLEIPINLFYASEDLCKNKIFPKTENHFIAYSDDAYAILALLNNSLLVNNEIKIHPDDIKLVNSKIYLYKISSNNFIKYNGLDTKTYVTSLYAKIVQTIEIKNILEALQRRGYCISYI